MFSILVLFILVHSSELWVGCEISISWNGLYPVFCLHFCFLTEKGMKRSVSLLKCIYGLANFWDQHWKRLQKRLPFWCFLHVIYIETRGSTLKRNFFSHIRNLRVLSEMQWERSAEMFLNGRKFSQQAAQHQQQLLDVGRGQGRGEEVLLL